MRGATGDLKKVIKGTGEMKNKLKKQVNNRSKKGHIKATSWKPGQTGNPNGRPPKGYSITETVREMMTKKPATKKALGTKILEMALQGDISAIKTIWSYMDGTPVQSNIISGDEKNPVRIDVGLMINKVYGEDKSDSA